MLSQCDLIPLNFPRAGMILRLMAKLRARPALSRPEVETALERARETVRATNRLAARFKGMELRDVLLLEALALQSVIERIEKCASPGIADAAELEEQVDRVMRVVRGNVVSFATVQSRSIH